MGLGLGVRGLGFRVQSSTLKRNQAERGALDAANVVKCRPTSRGL